MTTISIAEVEMPRLGLVRKKIGTPAAAASAKQMSCRFVRLHMTFVLTDVYKRQRCGAGEKLEIISKTYLWLSGAKSQGIKQLMAGGGVVLIGTTLIPLLSGLF